MNRLTIKKLIVGPLASNCLILADENTKEALIVDPGDEPDRIIDVINKNNFKIKYIICTHAHFDHVGAVSDIKQETGAPIVIHRDEQEIYRSTREQAALWGFDLEVLPEPDMLVSEGDILEAGSLKFLVVHTPGHSPGGICLSGEGVLITGDTIFAGSVGRTDLYGGNIVQLKKSFKRLMSFSEETKIFPGHGPETTVEREKKENFLSLETLE